MRKHRTPAGTRCYAIGDIHGRADRLRDLHRMIAEDARSFKGERIVLVYLGDYIDRGPQSREVLDILTHLPPVYGAKRVFLKGNHEHSLLDFFARPAKAQGWLEIWGGNATLESYGILPKPRDKLKDLADRMRAALPKRHEVLLRNLKIRHAEGDYLFVHAGIRPGVAPTAQTEEDMMMIRDEFMGIPHGQDCTVVFGHTIVPEPLVAEDRIGVDTGAYTGAPLTAVVLEDKDVRFLQAKNPAAGTA